MTDELVSPEQVRAFFSLLDLYLNGMLYSDYPPFPGDEEEMGQEIVENNEALFDVALLQYGDKTMELEVVLNFIRERALAKHPQYDKKMRKLGKV